MRKRRGTTLIEAVTGAVVGMLVVLGMMSMFVSGLTYMYRTNTDLYLAGKDAQGLRWMSEYARTAMSATIASGGNEVDFTLPKTNAAADSYTGEKEYTYPLAGDGVTRGFKVDFTAGTLTDLHTGIILAKNITSTDPDPKSSTYNQAYTPFSFSIVGSHKVIVMQIISKQKIDGNLRYERMKETVMLRNT